MRPFSDKPYRYFPPKYNPLFAWLLRRVSCHIGLASAKKITGVETSGGEGLAKLLRERTHLLFLPNHPTHADGPILTEALRQERVKTAFMAAYDVFLRSRSRAWAMQVLGGFSVDRECCDRRALKQADATLCEGRLPLTIFPEGHVYLQNDQVTPFSEGALFIGMAAARRLAKEGKRVVAVPVSMKSTYVVDVRPLLAERLRDLAHAVGASLAADMTAREALRAVGLKALTRNLKHRGIPFPEQGPLPARIRLAAESVLDALSGKVGTPTDRKRTVMERIRHARRVAHEVLLDPQREVDHAAARLWSDEAMLAWRIASYSGDYVAAEPSLDRIAETVEKLEEDAFSRFVKPLAKRRAIVRFGAPLDLTEAATSGQSLRPMMSDLTGRMEQAVQLGLDEINERNAHRGAELWNEPLGAAAEGG